MITRDDWWIWMWPWICLTGLIALALLGKIMLPRLADGKTKSFVTGDKTRNNFGKTKKFCDSKSKDLTKHKFIRFCAGCFRNKSFFLSNCVLTEGGYAALNVFFPHYLQKGVLNIKKLSGLQLKNYIQC